MSCVLRVSNSSVDSTSSNVSLKPFRAENTTEHFNVSDAEFDNFKAQIEDAIAFLDQYRADIQLLMAAPRASGVLDFAIESRDVPVQCDYFPAPLVRAAGNLGLALALSCYSSSIDNLLIIAPQSTSV